MPSSQTPALKTAFLRAEPHNAVAAVLQRDAGAIVERWATRAREERPAAARVHHDALLDHLPVLLWELGRALAATDPAGPVRSANVHGDQRWEIGWSAEEVVRDYQLLRVVVAEHLDQAIARPLTPRELLALGVHLDDAVAASVAAYAACQAAASDLPAPGLGGRHGDELLGILGVLGHELRNPLAPLGNAVQALALAADDGAVVERARGIMDRQVRAMTRLVDDLLDLPRLLRGKVRLAAAPVDLAAVVRDCAEDRRAAFEAAGVGLAVELPEGPVETTGDPARLAQVVGNLLANALKFTDRGGAVRVRLAADAAARTAVLSVRDTGVGIDPAVLDRMFEPFVQAERSVDRSRGGLGLGLALVRGLVELHGGSVRGASDGAGKGAEFVVELPVIERPPAGSAGTPGLVTATSRRVLVVEDNRDSADSLKLFLELAGHRVDVAYSGPDGLRMAREKAPEVVLCDIGLPGMSGHAVCAALRADPALAGTLLVALTGHADDARGGDGEPSGFDLYLLKPVDPARLADAIASGRGAESSV